MFCRYCGNEILENEFVCRKCGCLVDGVVKNTQEDQTRTPQTPVMQTGERQPTAQALPKKPSRKFFRLTKIFSGVATALSCLAALFALWFFGLMDAALSSGNASAGDVNYGGMAIAIFAIFGLCGMFAVSPFALTTGILAFVFKRKSPERTGAFPIVAFVLGIISFVGTILCFVLLLR